MTDLKPVAATPHLGTLVVIGLGLIGGSVAIACKTRGVARRIVGITLDEATGSRAKTLGIVDEAHVSIAAIAPQLGAGDMIFIAVPTLSVRKVLAAIAPIVDSAVTITDGASVKGSVWQDVLAVYGEMPPQVVLGHPIAGSEKSGVEAANPNLYDNHRVILTPDPATGHDHLARVRQMWQAIGAEVLELSIADHDEILGATSHLPHAIAFALVDTLAHDSQNENIFRYAAGGFRDFTRIASSDATMWRDIMLANTESVLHAIDLFSANLASMRSAIENQDSTQLLAIFSRAKAARDHFTQMLAQRSNTASQHSLNHLPNQANHP